MKQQDYSNHVRYDPLFHFFLIPVLLITLVATVVHLVRHPGVWSAWFVVLALALLVIAFKSRANPLKVQDRLIRLEEQMRLVELLPAAQRVRIGELNERQLVALRFASDGELPALVERTLDEKMTPKEIKQAIRSWRPDTFRV